jgi:DNA polymerase III delta prime subunit
MILGHLNKDNLHHAYLIEGNKDEIVPEILSFCKNINIKTSGNPDFCHIVVDNFKIDEALDLRAMSINKSFSLGHSATGEASSKKIFLICVNNFSLDAQNVLLKMFEEPIEHTHFFVITPDADALLKTLFSRFYFIPTRQGLTEHKIAENFIKMSTKNRIDFIKEFLAISEEEEDIAQDSSRAKSLRFLNALEVILSKTVFDINTNVNLFEHFFKVREFLRMPGSSTKSLMESVALVIPNF